MNASMTATLGMGIAFVLTAWMFLREQGQRVPVRIRRRFDPRRRP